MRGRALWLGEKATQKGGFGKKVAKTSPRIAQAREHIFFLELGKKRD